MKGIRLRSLFVWMALVFLGAGVLVAYVWKQNYYITQSKTVQAYTKERAQLINEIAAVEVSVNRLKRIERLEKIARTRLGLDYGSNPVLVFGDKAEKDSDEPVRLAGLWNVWRSTEQ